jgi:hypothetical protein
MKLRFRHLFLIGGSALVLLALFLTDPDRGITTGMLLLSLVAPILAVAFTHLARKALHDYPEADARRLFSKAGEDPVGSGLALVALAIVAYGLLALFGGAARAGDIPARAHQYLPVVSAELDRTWPGAPIPREYLGALIHHESACSVSARKCWNPAVRLKTQREEGAGLGQLTRAYSKTGALRFDKLDEMRAAHPGLREISWSNIYQRPDLQIRAMVIMVKSGYGKFSGTATPLEFADAGYNGGDGGVQKERRACGLTPGCDPQRWFGHVERVCLKSRTAIYGQRSACDINRHHVHDVIRIQMPRYRGSV